MSGSSSWTGVPPAWRIVFAATAASAQAAISEPAAFQALYPYRDVLNNGAPTPAAKLVLEPPAVLQRLQALESGIGVVEAPRRISHRARR